MTRHISRNRLPAFLDGRLCPVGFYEDEPTLTEFCSGVLEIGAETLQVLPRLHLSIYIILLVTVIGPPP